MHYVKKVISEYLNVILDTPIEKYYECDSLYLESIPIDHLPVVFQSTIALEILHPLSATYHDDRLTLVCDTLSSWLYRQRNRETETYNWWNNASLTHQYPDDLDDTVCAWHALLLNSHIHRPPHLLTQILQLLFSLELKPGGPYKTWIVDQKDSLWSNVDFVVQCNVLYLLSHWNVTLEPCLEYISQSITQKAPSSFYPSLSAYYFFARMYAVLPNATRKFPHVIQAVTTIIVEIEHHLHSPLDKHHLALSLIILLKLKEDYESLSPYVRMLCSRTQKECHGIICLHTKKGSQTTYAGSSLLTNLFCVETLSLYQLKIEEEHDAHTIVISTTF